MKNKSHRMYLRARHLVRLFLYLCVQSAVPNALNASKEEREGGRGDGGAYETSWHFSSPVPTRGSAGFQETLKFY